MNTTEPKKIENILVQQTKTIKEVMKTIDMAGTRTAIVVDDNIKLLGIVTDGDIRRGILKGLDISEPVSKVMNTKPTYVTESASEEEISETLRSHKIINAPLVDNNMVVKDIIFLNEGKGIVHLNKSCNIQHIHKPITKVLVIGGGGYIGSVLVRKLLDKGYEVRVLDKFVYGKDSLNSVKDNPKLKIVEGDTRHIEDITAAARDMDAVVHLAEVVGDPACALNPSTTQEINYLATRTVAMVCKHFQINRLIYTSSCSVYGASKADELLTEESPLNPISLYAKMKIASEKALMDIKDENFMPTILRLSTVFGKSHRPRFDLVVNLLTAKALREKKITIFGGDQWRPNVHVSDVGDTIIAVLEAPIDKVGGKVFNVGHEENNHTINDIGRIIKSVHPDAELVIENQSVDKRDYKVSFSRLRDTLNINLNKGVEIGVKEIKEFLEENPDMDHNEIRFSNIKYLQENNLT